MRALTASPRRAKVNPEGLTNPVSFHFTATGEQPMNNMRKTRAERNARCVAFCDERPADFPEGTLRGEILAKLRALQKQIETLDAECTTHDRLRMQGTSGKKEERAALQKMVTTVIKTADVAGLDHLEIKGAFQRPKANSNDQTLLSTARSIAAAVTAHKSAFREYDLPEDFDEQLKTRVESFAQYTQRKVSAASAKATTNSELAAAFRALDQELRRLNALVRNKYTDDPAALEAWERAYRLERRRPGRNGGAKGGLKKDPDDEK